MFKQLKSIIGILTGLLIAQSTHAALINMGFDTYDSPYLNAVDYFSEVRPMTSLITSGGLSYEDTDGTGTLNINSSSTIYGDMEINDAMLTTNNDGSLRVNGTIHFLTLGSSSTFIGDMAITYGLDDSNSVTQFSYSPIANNGSNHNGLLMIDGPFAWHLLEFNTTTSLLAYVDNPFPVYSPVPVPAALWLFGSGLIGLVGFARRKKT